MYTEWENLCSFILHRKEDVSLLTTEISSRPNLLYKKDVLENFAKFTETPVPESLFK